MYYVKWKTESEVFKMAGEMLKEQIRTGVLSNGGNDDNRADPLVYLDTASRQEKHFTMTGKRSQNGMDIGGR